MKKQESYLLKHGFATKQTIATITDLFKAN